MSAERAALERAIKSNDLPLDWALVSEPWRTLANAVDELELLREFRASVMAACDNYAPSSQPEMDLGELFGVIYAGDEKLRDWEGG